MDMMFVKVDETVKVNDEVELIKDNNHIYEKSKTISPAK